MKFIQLILLVLSLTTGILGVVIFRSKLIFRFITAFLFCLTTILVILPDLTTDLAHALGVGRGADLLLYIVFFAAFHAFLLLYMRTRKLEHKLTESIRALAIRDARFGETVAAGSASPVFERLHRIAARKRHAS